MCKTYYILQNDLSLLAFQLPSVLELHFHYVIIYFTKLYITILLVASVYICHFYLWCTSTYFFPLLCYILSVSLSGLFVLL